MCMSTRTPSRPRSSASRLPPRYRHPLCHCVRHTTTKEPQLPVLSLHLLRAVTGSQAVMSGKSVVIDNTNPSVSARAEFIKIAKQKGWLSFCPLAASVASYCLLPPAPRSILPVCSLLHQSAPPNAPLHNRAGIPVRCFVFQMPENLALHLNTVRMVLLFALSRAVCVFVCYTDSTQKMTNGAVKVPQVAYSILSLLAISLCACSPPPADTYKKQYVEPALKEGFSEIKARFSFRFHLCACAYGSCC
jgi:hypothetical protein